MNGRKILDKVGSLRSRLREYDGESDDEPLVTLLERMLKIDEAIGDALDALENRLDVLEEEVDNL